MFVFNEYPRQAKRSVIFTQGRSQQGEKHGFLYACAEYHLQPNTSPAKMSTHALEKMSLDLFRAMSLAPRQKYPRNVVEMKEAMAAFSGSDSVAISWHCKRSKIILVEVLTEVCSLENIASVSYTHLTLPTIYSV